MAIAYLLLGCLWGLVGVSLWDMALSLPPNGGIYTIPQLLSSAADIGFRELKWGPLLLVLSFAVFVGAPVLMSICSRIKNGVWCLLVACTTCLVWLAVPMMFASSRWLRWQPLDLFQVSMTLVPLTVALHPNVSGSWAKWLRNYALFRMLVGLLSAAIGGLFGLAGMQFIFKTVHEAARGDTLGPDLSVSLLGLFLVPIAIWSGGTLGLYLVAPKQNFGSLVIDKQP